MTTTDITSQLAGLQSALAHVSDRLVHVEALTLAHDGAIARLTAQLDEAGKEVAWRIDAETRASKERWKAIRERDSARAEVERLTKELGETITARDEAVEVVAQLRRDCANADALAESRWRWANSVADVERGRTAEAIAAWLGRCKPDEFSRRDYGTQNVDAELFRDMARMLADAIRAGRWRP